MFEIVKSASGYASTPTTLVSFDGANGVYPLAGLIMDAKGDLFGTTTLGGANNDGTMFEIADSASGYASTPTTLVSFNNTDGSTTGQSPVAGLVADAKGDLFGTTALGGNQGVGTVFEIVKAGAKYASTPTYISTDGAIGHYPEAGLIADAKGDLFGTTSGGGAGGEGTVFELVNSASGYTPTVLVSFFDAIGDSPIAGLIADAKGDLFGTTSQDGGRTAVGTVFEITDSGFVVACYCRGTRILTPRGEVAVEELAIGDRVVTAAGLVEPVRWIGRRSYAGRFLSGQPHLLPILFRAGSLGSGLPHRDLRVSPAHAMLLDGLLIPAACLVNGTSIVQDGACCRVDYVHVELAQHDVILAEGAASETFLDDDSRGMFHNALEYAALYPGARAVGRYCARHVDIGYELEAIRRRLVAISCTDDAASSEIVCFTTPKM